VADDATIDRAHYEAVRAFPMDLEDGEWMGPYWDDYLDRYARVVGVPADLIPEAIEHLRNEYVTGWLWTHVIEGSPGHLADLVATGVPVGIVSNSDVTIERRLGDMGILQVGPGVGVEVRCLIDSGTVGVEKPDPQIFDYAFEQLDMDPDGIWYVGDTPAFDIIAASKAGLEPILMDPFGVNADYGVETVKNLGEVAEMVNGER
jgi:putative hydrolase of the HAD superfamily